MRKYDLKTYFAYSWGKYLIGIVAIILFWSWCTNLIIKPKFNERINIFIGANNCDLSFLNQYKEDYDLKEINIIYHNPEDAKFYTVLSSSGVVDTDIIIIDINYFNDENILLWFKEIEQGSIDNYYNEEIKFYYKNGKAYGINLRNDLYLFFNKSSLNLGKMNPEDFENDKALIISNIILEEVDNHV